MSTLSISIDAKDVLKFLENMPPKLENALDRSIHAAGELIGNEARNVTPVDTGRLRASIHTVNQHLRSEVGTNVKYAVYVHDGTKYMRPRPFMIQGVENASDRIKDVANRLIREAIT